MSNNGRIKRTRVAAIGAAISLAVGLAILATSIALTYMRANYIDVTHAPEYGGIVGKEYTFAIPMPACGITMDQDYKPLADVVEILAPPGFGGPEVLWCHDLPKGTAFRVVGIKRCTNCLGGSKDRVMVDIAPARGYRGLPASLWGDVLSKDEVGRSRLNFRFYTPR